MLVVNIKALRKPKNAFNEIGVYAFINLVFEKDKMVSKKLIFEWVNLMELFFSPIGLFFSPIGLFFRHIGLIFRRK